MVPFAFNGCQEGKLTIFDASAPSVAVGTLISWKSVCVCELHKRRRNAQRSLVSTRVGSGKWGVFAYVY